MDRQGTKIAQELREIGRIKMSKLHGLHFEFDHPALHGCGIYLRNVGDPSAYRGIEFDFLLIDELTEFMRDDWDHLMYLLRSSKNLPFEAFGAGTNPDGVGHGWVKKLWIEREFSDEPALQHIKDEFHFIQAKAYENPTFNERREMQLTSFSDPMLVKARWEGSWDIASGVRFPQFKRNIHVFDWPDFERAFGGDHTYQEILKTPELFTFYGSLDYGTDLNSGSAFHIHAVDFKKRVWTIAELYMQGVFLVDQAREIKELLAKMPFDVNRIYCDPSLVGKDSDGISRWAKFRAEGVHMVPGINDRIEGWGTLDRLLHHKRVVQPDGSDYLEIEPQWRVHNSCRHLIRQITTAPRGSPPRYVEDLDPRFTDDHALDGVRYMLHSYFKGRAVKEHESPRLKALRKMREGLHTPKSDHKISVSDWIG